MKLQSIINLSSGEKVDCFKRYFLIQVKRKWTFQKKGTFNENNNRDENTSIIFHIFF